MIDRRAGSLALSLVCVGVSFTAAPVRAATPLPVRAVTSAPLGESSGARNDYA
ncbi:MAG: hypothetical protein IAI50_15285, partial [Candidatus Eremiobacteraeota bacterium]|nr:hypothetical protein [Candidatus Eremiobacteraeota bacterium]